MNNSAELENFKNPPNHNEVIERIHSARNLGEVCEIIKETFPTWIVGLLKAYSSDYPSLDQNWKEICQKSDCPPTEILLVRELAYDEAYSLIHRCAELFTKAGFCVRRFKDIIPCSVCNAALPTAFWHERLKSTGKTVPEVWQNHCLGCEPKEEENIEEKAGEGN